LKKNLNKWELLFLKQLNLLQHIFSNAGWKSCNDFRAGSNIWCSVKYSGKVGKDLSEEEGKAAAKLCALNCLSAIKSVIGSLDKIKRVLKLTVFVSSAEGFTAQQKLQTVHLNL